MKKDRRLLGPSSPDTPLFVAFGRERLSAALANFRRLCSCCVLTSALVKFKEYIDRHENKAEFVFQLVRNNMCQACVWPCSCVRVFERWLKLFYVFRRIGLPPLLS